MISFRVGDYFANIFAHISPFGYVPQSSEPPAFARCSEQLKSLSETVLNHTIIARYPVTVAGLIAFEEHRWICREKWAIVT